MAGTITQAHDEGSAICLYTFTCVADAVDGSFPSTLLTTPIAGWLLALETNPGATAPTDDYDIALTDGDGHDVLQGVGGNRDAAATEKTPIVYSATSIHPPVSEADALTLAITNSIVNDAQITIKLYYEKAATPGGRW